MLLHTAPVCILRFRKAPLFGQIETTLIGHTLSVNIHETPVFILCNIFCETFVLLAVVCRCMLQCIEAMKILWTT